MSYTADYLLPFALQHVFIDTDNNVNTGWVTSSSPGPAIGGDYMIEKGSFYKYAGSGTDWSWTYVGAVTPSGRNWVTSAASRRALVTRLAGKFVAG
jgi:hypothetical protein